MAKEKPQSKLTQEVVPKKVPTLILGLSLFVQQKWGVPLALVSAICCIETQYGENIKGKNNWFNLRPINKEDKANDEGYSEFNNVKDCFDRFGHRASKGVKFKRIRYIDPRGYSKSFAKAWFGDTSKADDILHYIKEHYTLNSKDI